MVRIVPSPIATAKGLFKVVLALPTERGVHQYRIKAETDGHERVVTEVEIRLSADDAASRDIGQVRLSS
jgi:hypothetical protein